MSSTGTSKRSLERSSSRGSRATREHRREKVVLGESRKRDRIESRPFRRICIVDIDIQRMVFGIDARRGHWNQTALLEEPAAVDDQVADAPLSRIDNHAVERADSRTGLR